MDIFKNEIIEVLKRHRLENAQIEIPPDSSFGDFAVPCFAFSKEQKKAPQLIAKETAEKLSSPLFEKITANGPYINFFVNHKELAKEILKKIEKEKDKYGLSLSGKEKKVMIEFSSPNTNKPLHLGHVRNILLGESLSRIYGKTSHEVIRACLVNDRGVHICKSMLAYKMWGENSKPNKKSDHFVGDWYVKFANEAKENKTLEKDALEMLKLWEEKDKETLKLWEKMNKWVYDGFDETYKSLGIKFDKIYYESKIYGKGKVLVSKGLKEGIFELDEKNNIVAPLKKHGFGEDKVVLRSDGTAVYITQDIYLAKKKFEDYSLDNSFYVVASEQNLHFLQLFKIIEILNLAKTENLKHVSYGMVNLPEGKMKSREGNVVDADDIIDEVISLAKEEVIKRYNDLGEEEVEERSRKIGIGALKFFMLKNDSSKDMTYDPKESVSFEGETGPYVQYAYARINSIFDKGGIDKISTKVDYSLYDKDEKQIIKKLGSYPDTILDAMRNFKPSLVARYSLDLSQMFNEYYHSHQILKESEDIKNARLLLLDSIRIVIKNGLELLGIDVVERM